MKQMQAKQRMPSEIGGREEKRPRRNSLKRPLLLLVGLAVLFTGGLVLTRALDRRVYITVVNESKGDIYGMDFYYSYSGRTFPHLEQGDGGVGATQPRVGSNDRIPFAPGEKVDLEIPRREGGELPPRMTMEFFVEMSPTATATDRVPTVGPLEIPVAAGRRTVLVLTGSREAGFSLAVRGIESR